MAKNPTSLRISDYTKAQIEQIAAYMNANQTEAVAMSVASFYRELFGNKNPMKEERTMKYDTELAMRNLVTDAKSLLEYTKGTPGRRAHEAANAAIDNCSAELSMQQFAGLMEAMGGQEKVWQDIVKAIS